MTALPVESSMRVFRQNIAFLLAHERRTQRALAAYIGVSTSHLSHVLSSRKKPQGTRKSEPERVRTRVPGKRPSVDNLSASSFDAIAAFFNVELWMLFRDDLPQMVTAAEGGRRRKG